MHEYDVRLLFLGLGLIILARLQWYTYQQLRRLMSTTPPGLLALNKAIQDLIAAINANTAAINTALPALQASEDPAVQQAAATIETSVGDINKATQALSNATAPPPPPAPAASKGPVA